MAEDRPDIVVGIPKPDRGYYSRAARESLQHMVAHARHEGMTVYFAEVGSADVAGNRNIIIEKALEIKANYVMFVDDDMVCPVDGITRLIKADKDIISGLCCKRAAPYEPVVFLRNHESLLYNHAKKWAHDRVMEVDAAGAAFVLVKTSALKKMGKPYFSFAPFWMVEQNDEYKRVYDMINRGNMSRDEMLQLVETSQKKIEVLREKLDRQVSEDVYFCNRAQKAGLKIWVDTGCVVGHLGEKAYTVIDFIETMKLKEDRESA